MAGSMVADEKSSSNSTEATCASTRAGARMPAKSITSSPHAGTYRPGGAISVRDAVERVGIDDLDNEGLISCIKFEPWDV